MLITQYFDLLRDVGANGKCSTVFLGSVDGGGEGAGGDLVAGLRRAILEGQSMER